MLSRIVAFCIVALCLAIEPLEAAQAADEVFAGKTINVIAGFPPGGGVDGEMRVLARFLAKYIPGQPNIVARNMQGAGGIILANHLYNMAAADGLTIGMPGRSGFLLSNVVPQKGINYFTAGGSAKLRSGDIVGNSALTAKGYDTGQSFMLVEIDGDLLRFQTISRQGKTVDSGEIRRTPTS